MAAPFFFSYAHNDAYNDPGIDAFYQEVSKHVRFLAGVKEDGFRDKEDLRAGEVWSDQVAEELRTTSAIVCMYSPSYFESGICGKEMQVFLERRSQHLQDNPGSWAPPIIPVLWQPFDRTPWSLPDFQFEKPRSVDLDGVWSVSSQNKHDELVQIARAVAVRIKEARKKKLPPLSYRPVLKGLLSAFDPPPLPPLEFDANGAAIGPQCATFVYPASPVWKDWLFGPDEKPLLHISTAVARGRELQSHQLTFEAAAADLADRLKVARERNNLLVLLLDEATLGNLALIQRLQEFDALDEDNVKVGVVVASRSPRAALLPGLAQALPKLSLRQAPFLQVDLTNEDKVAEAVGGCLDALRASIPQGSRAVNNLQTDSQYSVLPNVEGPGKRDKAA